MNSGTQKHIFAFTWRTSRRSGHTHRTCRQADTTPSEG